MRSNRVGVRREIETLCVLCAPCGCFPVGAAYQCGHLGDLRFEQLAEQGTDVDAGKKIARATRTSGGAGVITELGMVKRELHERGHRQRTAFTQELRERPVSLS